MWEFVAIVTATVVGLFLYALSKNGVKWLKTKDGKGILFGLVVAPLAAIAISLLLGGCSSSNPYIEVYAGIERTKNVSPQCKPAGADMYLTSNLGIQGCNEVSYDGRTTACLVYRHHSCAISMDLRSYDAFGVIVSRRVYLQ